MRGSSACVLLNAQNLADRSRSWARQRRGHAQLFLFVVEEERRWVSIVSAAF
jgi:hypothetical protein